MSEETNEKSSGSAAETTGASTPGKSPAEKASAVGPGSATTPAATKPAAAAKAEAPPPPPPEPGEFGQRLQAAGFAITPLEPDAGGTEMLQLDRDSLLKACAFLRDECQFDLALSCTGVDRKEHRESVYHVYSLKTHKYLAIKVQADGNDHSPSLMPVWPAVDWHERESYDLMGIVYDGHVDLKRILMPVDWLGHPLRKDYKVDDPRLVWNER